MLSPRKLLLVAFALACLNAASCARPSNNDAPQNVAANAPPRESPVNAKPATEAARTHTFRGQLGDRLQIEMKLRREGGALNGSYFYTNVKQEITLRGTIDGKGDFTLEEFDAAGKQTGIFKGAWTTNDAGDAELKGRWSRPDGSRALEFALEELPIEFSEGVRLVTKEIRKSDKKRNYTVEAEYPQIEGAAGFDGFNRSVREIAEREVADFEGEAGDWEPSPYTKTESNITIGYRFGLANDQLVNVQFQVSTYYSGAAHPNQHTRVVNYDLKRQRTLALADLFKPEALYLRALSDYCVADLKKQFRQDGFDDPQTFDAGIEEGAAPNADNYQSWLVTRGGLEITFDPYQVAPYAAGPQRVLVPYSALKDFIDPQGPLAPFIK